MFRERGHGANRARQAAPRIRQATACRGPLLPIGLSALPVAAARPITLRAAERERLKKMAYGQKTEHRLRIRSQVVLHAARGRSRPVRRACLGRPSGPAAQRRTLTGGHDEGRSSARPFTLSSAAAPSGRGQPRRTSASPEVVPGDPVPSGLFDTSSVPSCRGGSRHPRLQHSDAPRHASFSTTSPRNGLPVIFGLTNPKPH